MEDPNLYAPSLQNILDQQSLKWIFVGGKGGVGKTTVSCCLSILLSRVRKNVLLISTDPAHNLSDAFGQRFGRSPLLVNGFANLSVLEIDPNVVDEDDDGDDVLNASEERKLFNSLATAMPGIDEAMGFSNVMKLVQSMEFEVVVFDTAPTGHTLRFLQFPQLLSKTFGKIFDLQGSLGGLFSQMVSMMGGNGMPGPEQLQGKLAKTQQVVESVSAQFQDPRLSTFIAVTIPEFLSLYETERLLQELAQFHMDCRNIVVNQILDPAESQCCRFCKNKSAVQQIYLGQIEVLYKELFHLTYLPALQMR